MTLPPSPPLSRKSNMNVCVHHHQPDQQIPGWFVFTTMEFSSYEPPTVAVHLPELGPLTTMMATVAANLAAAPANATTRMRLLATMDSTSPNPWDEVFATTWFYAFYTFIFPISILITMLVACSRLHQVLTHAKPSGAGRARVPFLPVVALVTEFCCNLQRLVFVLYDPWWSRHRFSLLWGRIMISISLPFSFLTSLLVAVHFRRALSLKRDDSVSHGTVGAFVVSALALALDGVSQTLVATFEGSKLGLSMEQLNFTVFATMAITQTLVGGYLTFISYKVLSRLRAAADLVPGANAAKRLSNAAIHPAPVNHPPSRHQRALDTLARRLARLIFLSGLGTLFLVAGFTFMGVSNHPKPFIGTSVVLVAAVTVVSLTQILVFGAAPAKKRRASSNGFGLQVGRGRSGSSGSASVSASVNSGKRRLTGDNSATAGDSSLRITGDNLQLEVKLRQN